MSELSRKIEFRKIRDFGETLNVSALFLRQNFKRIVRSLLILAGPFILVGSMAPLLSLSNPDPVGFAYSSPASRLMGSYGINFIALLVGFVMAVAVVYEYTLLYADSESENLPVEFNTLWASVRRHFIKILLSMIGLCIMLVIAVFLLTLLLTVAVTPIVTLFAGFISKTPFFAGIIGFGVGLLFFGGIMLVLSPLFLLFFPVFLHEKIDFFSALSRCYALAKGHWWPSAGLIFVCSVITFSITLLIQVPATMIRFSSAFFDPSAGSSVSGMTALLVGIGIIGSAFHLLIVMLYTVIGTSHYFSVVESHESIGLLERIQSMGTRDDEKTKPAYDDYYAEEERF